MRLNEIAGPGDYRAGDEHNPGSPDYDPRPRKTPDRARSNQPDDDSMFDRDRKSAAQKSRAYTTSNKIASGEHNGKPYNVVSTISGPPDGLANQVRKYMDFQTNIYHKFAGVDSVENDDGTATANIYIQAEPQSLVLRSAT